VPNHSADLLPTPQRFSQRHRVSGFDSGEPEVNDYLVKHALTHAEAGFSTTWVIPDPHDRSIWGFVSLGTASQVVQVEGRRGKKRLFLRVPVLDTCPYPEIPVIEIIFLGTRQDKQGKGIAKRLLGFSILKAIKVSRDVGVAGIILDALTDPLLQFYSKLKFDRLPYPPESGRRRMLLTMADARIAAQLAGIR
jgi:GNAT superfamily N-acetyltransferase